MSTQTILAPGSGVGELGLLWKILVGVLGLLGFSGCSDDFKTTEPDIESGSKTRPFTISLHPAEAGPGEEVTVTMCLYEPHPTATHVTWQAALDYNINIYGDQQTEASVIDLDGTPPLIGTPEGFMTTQTFRFTIPENTMLVSSAVDDLFEDPFSPEVSALFDPATPGVLTKEEINRFYSTVDPESLSPEAFGELQLFADHFVCQIRLRAKIHNADQIDVTKNVTVRYSGKFESRNVNRNPGIDWIAVLAVHEPDLETSVDIDEFEIDTTYVFHHDPSQIDSSPIEVNPDWSYFMAVDHDEQTFWTPAGQEEIEEYSYKWYFSRVDGPGNGEDFFDWYDSKVVLLKNPIDRSVERYEILTVVRDFRAEWDTYETGPGSTYEASTVRFSFP